MNTIRLLLFLALATTAAAQISVTRDGQGNIRDPQLVIGSGKKIVVASGGELEFANGSIFDIPDNLIAVSKVVGLQTALDSKLAASAFTGAATRDLLAGLSGDNRLDATAIKNLPSVGNGQATIKENIAQTAHGFTLLQPVAISGSGYVLARANAAGTANVAGFVIPRNANSFDLLTAGVLDASVVTSLSLTPGFDYYLSSATAGAWATTSPTGLTEYRVLLFRVDNAGNVILVRGPPDRLNLIAPTDIDIPALEAELSIPSSDTAAQVRDKLQTLTGADRLDASAIKNLPTGGGGDGIPAGMYTLWPTANLANLPSDYFLAGQFGTTDQTALSNLSFVVRSLGDIEPVSFSVPSGAVASGTTVALDTISDPANIRYTTNGTTPTRTTGTVYSAPISVTSAVTIKAIPYYDGYRDGPVTESSYSITTSYPLDGITTNAFFAFSASRYLRAAYTGPVIQLRENGGNTTKDFKVLAGSLVTNDANEDTVSEWLTANSATIAFVSVWYDQSGNGRNFQQTDNSLQPRLTLAWSNGKPAIHNPHNGGTVLTRLSSAASISGFTSANQSEMFGVVDSEVSESVATLFGNGAGTSTFRFSLPNQRPEYYADSGANLIAPSAISGKVLISAYRAAGTGSQDTRIRVNAAEVHSGLTGSNDIRSGTWAIFAPSAAPGGANQIHWGHIAELIWINGTTSSTDRTQIESSTITHFSL